MSSADTRNANLTMPSRHQSNANPMTASSDTNNADITAASIDTSNANPQKESPLFARVPGEIRDHIFDLALTAYSGKQEPFAKDSYYYRPGFRYADQKLDTALLRTCRRIYQETRLVPYQNYERVEWHECDRGPSVIQARRFARDRVSTPWLTSLHMFTQQFWLEDSSWPTQARRIAQRQNLRHLKITIRHSGSYFPSPFHRPIESREIFSRDSRTPRNSIVLTWRKTTDWWWWESSTPLALDAKQKGTPYATSHSSAADGFHVKSWGHQFSVFKGLKTFELELETVEGKRKELDEIVIRAADWQFPLGDGNVLVLNAAKTKKTGWHGMNLRKCFDPLNQARAKTDARALTKTTASGLRVSSDPKQAKERLVKDGVDFTVWDGEPEISGYDCLTYYVVALTYEAQRGPTST